MYVIMHITLKHTNMKKLLLAILVFMFSTGAMFAQTAKPAQEKGKMAKKATNTGHQQVSAATTTTAPAEGSTAKKMKKDGTPDKRYKENKHVKKDGTADKRFKENKDKKE